MTAHPVGDLQPIPTRPGQLGRTLIGTEHGISSFYLAEIVFEAGAAIPLHTHPVEEAFMVAQGTLTLRLGDEELTASAESVVSVPAGVPHAVRNAGPDPARALAAAAWNRATFFREATTFLEGDPRE
jgi:quercetin dioxygenase-like cupin family protein